MSKKKTTTTATELTIAPPNLQVAEFRIIGTAPYVQHKFSHKAREMMHATQAAGSTAKKGKKKEAKDFQLEFEEALHVSKEGWHGIPSAAFRAGMVRACKLCGFAMTDAKCSFFVVADGYDADDGTAMTKITKGKPEYTELAVRLNGSTADLRVRPMWREGWEAVVKVRFDADLFTLNDMANLLMRVGVQVGIGEGRPDSPKSCGMGWGLFALTSK